MSMLFGSIEGAMRPSAVFAQRLRETRKARALSQEELARRMGEVGRPLGKASLVRVENETREPTLDEAFGLGQVLAAAPANLLSPPDGKFFAPIDGSAVDADGLRNWLLTGIGVTVWPDPPREEDRDKLRVWLQNTVTAHAGALADASRVNSQAGIIAAVDAIIAAVRQYQEALEGLTARAVAPR